jgi:4-hydroxyacetophenone monooxygenase
MTAIDSCRATRLTLDDESLKNALAVANIPALLMVLVHLTGDSRYLHPPFVPTPARGLDAHDSGGLDPEVQTEVRMEAFEVLRAWRDRGQVPPAPVSADRFIEMMGASIGGPVEPAQGPMVREQIGLGPDPDAEPPPPLVAASHHAVILGAGMSGILAAIRFEQAGIPYVVVEKNAYVGGTWLENHYPGCGVDTPGHLYAYSFEPATWSRFYPPWDEVREYLEQSAERHGVLRHVRFGAEAVKARWDEEAQRWHVRLRARDGTENDVTGTILISAVGQLNRPKVPVIPGLDSFTGQSAHTAAWRDDIDLVGKRVAVVGTGASSMQFVPAVADEAERVLVFQRSPQWASPNANYRQKISPEIASLFEQVPFYYEWYRFRLFWMFNDNVYWALQKDPSWPHPERSVNATNDRHREFLTTYIRSELGDRQELLPDVLPTYPPFGKRMLMDCGWYRTVARDDVDLVTERIEGVTANGVVTTDGVLHEVDVIAFATGFDALRVLHPLDIVGRGGQTIREVWGDDDAQAYLGVTVPGFPNFFCLYGPNTNPGHGGSVVFQAECQMHYVMALLRAMAERGVSTVDVRPEVHRRFTERVDAAHERMIWTHQGMDTWYRNARGRVVTNTPWRFVDYWAMTRTADLDEYSVDQTTVSRVA